MKVVTMPLGVQVQSLFQIELRERLEARREAIKFRPSSGFLCDEPQPRLPDAPDRGYPRSPAMNRQKGK